MAKDPLPAPIEGEFKPDLAIGVGCIWFAATEPSLKEPAYFDQLAACLGEIDSITNIKMSGQEGKYGDVVPLHVTNENLFFPHVYFSRLEFDVFIPYKVQEKLDAVCGTERFSVKVIGHYQLPVTYIAGSWDDFNGSPSTGIVLVRKYLEEKLTTNEFKCGCIGPSPFHADFFTLNGTEKDSLLDLSDFPGYKEYLFTYERSESAGLEEFIDNYGDTFALFYHLQNLRSKVLDSEIDVENATRELLHNAKSEGWAGRTRASMRSGNLIDKVNEAALEEQFYRSFIQNELERAEEEEPKRPFKDLSYHFNELRRFGAPRPLSMIRDVVSTFEKRRQGLMQNLTVLVAGLAGGILGAILGSALTYTLASSKPSTVTQRAAPSVQSPANFHRQGLPAPKSFE